MPQYDHGKNADAFLLSAQANQMSDINNQYVSSLIDQVDQSQLNEKGFRGQAADVPVPRHQQQYMGGGQQPPYPNDMD